MNHRERFLATLLFGEPDRVPLDPGGPSPGGPRASTLAAWRGSGPGARLPEGLSWRDHMEEILGLPGALAPAVVETGVSFRMHPYFEEQVLEHRDGHLIGRDWTGAVVEIPDAYTLEDLRAPDDFIPRRWLRFPVESRAGWEREIWPRYDPAASARFPAGWEERCRAARDQGRVVRVNVRGPFWQLRDWCGQEQLLTLMIDDPGFVAEMIGFWADFVIALLDSVQAHAQLDYVQVAEDMAFKLHSMISPAMAERFLLPTWARWVAAIQASGCPVVCMHCDGYVAELLPLWIDAGFNCCYPVEVAAGNDMLAYRRRCGERMAFIGGIDKRALAAGGDVMRAELMRVAPLLETGGFIPACDHAVPPDVSWPDFVEYTRLLARLTGWL